MKSKKKSENTSGQIKLKTQLSKNLWDAAKLVLRGKFISIQAFLKKQNKTKQKISNKQPNLPPKRIRKRRTNKPKVSKRKEIIKIR